MRSDRNPRQPPRGSLPGLLLDALQAENDRTADDEGEGEQSQRHHLGISGERFLERQNAHHNGDHVAKARYKGYGQQGLSPLEGCLEEDLGDEGAHYGHEQEGRVQNSRQVVLVVKGYSHR